MTILTEGFIYMVYSPFWEPNSWSLHRILLNKIHSLQLGAVRNLCKVSVDDSQMFCPGCPQCYYESLFLCSDISEILPRGANVEGSQWLWQDLDQAIWLSFLWSNGLLCCCGMGGPGLILVLPSSQHGVLCGYTMNQTMDWASFSPSPRLIPWFALAHEHAIAIMARGSRWDHTEKAGIRTDPPVPDSPHWIWVNILWKPAYTLFHYQCPKTLWLMYGKDCNYRN